jgi:membrane-associated phospholipid phosphatase
MVPYEASNNITDEQQEIVRHWSDRVGLTFTPAGHWVHILAAQIDADGTAGRVSLDQAARQFALLSLVQSDTFIANWKVKYRVMLERPVTYVQRLIDPEWLSFLPTPPHPEYPSGHSASSASAAAVLVTMLGERPFTDTTHDRIGWAPRSFESFAAAANEASMSRLYGGIHYPMATEAGAAQGRCLAATALDRLGITEKVQ